MNKFIYFFLFKTALFAFTNVFALAGEDTEDVREGKTVDACPIKVKTSGKCEGEECPYQINLPPMTIQLPKQFRLIEKTLHEVQTLKDEVNKLKKSCQECKLQADDNQEKDRTGFLAPNTEVPTENSKIQDNRVKELQSKVNKLSVSLQNAKNQIHSLKNHLEEMSLINMNNVENYVDSKVANLTYVVNSMDDKCSSKCSLIQPRPGA